MTSILKVSEIQDPTNSNTALTIDSAGRVFTPEKVAFMAPMANQSGRDISSVVDFPGSYYNLSNGNYYNNGGHWNTTTGKFVVPFDGLYYFSGQQRFDQYSGGNYVYIRLQLFDTDGTTTLRALSTCLWDGNFTYRCFNCDALANLTAGQQVSLRAAAIGDSSVDFDDGHFLGYHVG